MPRARRGGGQGESDEQGLQRKLGRKLASSAVELPQWDIGELLGQLWRPDFDHAQFFPYVPPHITRPVEQRKVFLVALPEKCVFAVPPAYQLLAIPLFEVHNSGADSGFSAEIAALPLWLSKHTFMF